MSMREGKDHLPGSTGSSIELDEMTCPDAEPRTCEEVSVVKYSVEDTPPWPLCVLMGLQHYLTAFGSTISVPLILAGPLCLNGDSVGLGEIISTVFFVSGLATLLQTTLGIRLPIIQGATFALLAPTLSILSLPEWQCPVRITVTPNTTNLTAPHTSVLLVLLDNGTTRLAELGSGDHREVWQSRLREVQGAIMVASLFQVLVGFSGIMSVFLRYIGPLVVAPTIALIGLSLFDAAAEKASQMWWIALLTTVLIVAFSQCMNRVTVPLPHVSLTRKDGCVVSTVRLPIFELFPVLIAMAVSWFLCLVLTVSNALPSDPEQWGFNGRTDARSGVITDAAWIRIPYPGQWGLPTVGLSAALGMVSGVLASMIESVGDYYACARMCGARPPPSHAMNRGIGIEGVACVIAGAFGSGNGTTSYSENIAAIGITKVASRRVAQVAGVLLVVMGSLGKIGAIFVTIPDPVVGGMFLAMFGMITAVGLSNLRYVDIRTPRNMCVLGMSLFIGLCVPRWVSAHKGAISTGSSIADQIIEVLLSTSMFVGGFVGFVLDNQLPGTDAERGLTQWRRESGTEEGGGETTMDTYSFPLFHTCIDRFPWLGRLPFCPSARKRTAPPASSQPEDDTLKEAVIAARYNEDGQGVV